MSIRQVFAGRVTARLAVLVFAVAIVPHTGLAQALSTSAALAGRVRDISGTPLAGVTVVAVHRERARIYQALTDQQGAYRFPVLAVGSYRLRIDVPGFAPFERDLELAVGDAITLPITLNLAGVAETVAVSADGPAIDVSRSEVAERVTPREISELPLNGRNYLDLALLAPGVNRTNTRNTERFAETSAVPGTGLSVLGQRNIGNTFIVDGVSANDDAADLAGTYFSQEVIREFQVITNGASAEFGRSSSGAFNIVTQSGANRVSGGAYVFARDESLDARNAFAATRDPLSQQQFGATLGGPLAADRTFYFANFEQTRNRRTGYVTIAAANVAAVNDQLDASGYAGPRVGTGAFPTGYDTSNVFARVDHQRTSGHLLSARYSFYDISSDNARTVGALNDVSRGTSLHNRDQSIAVSSVSTSASGLVHELRAQFWRSRLEAPGNDLIGPAVTISGVATWAASASSPTGRDLDVYQVNDTVTLQRGRHLVKGGADVLFNRLDIAFPGALAGSYTFSTLANFRSGVYTQYQQAFGDPRQRQDNPNLSLFAQDEWRATDAVTLSAGLRYDVQGIEDPVRTDWNNLSPRLGFAWAPATRRTVVRGAFGLYFDRIPLRAVSNALQRDGTKYRVAVLSFGQAGAPAFPRVLPAFPPDVLTAITTIDPGIESAESWQGSLQLEREISRQLSGTLAYQGLRGSKIIMSRNVNVPTLTAAEAALRGIANLGRPNPNFANISEYGSLGRSRYDGLSVSARLPLARVGHARVSYTLGKSLDDAGNAFFSTPQDNFDVHADWGLSDNDQRHRLVISGLAEARRLQLAWLFTYGSPQPFNIVTGGDRNNDTTVNDRPAGVDRNTGVGFEYASLDLRLKYDLRVTGRTSAELTADAFNVLNRANLLFPNSTFGQGSTPVASFGRATAAADPRQVQVGVRLRF